MSHFMFTDRVRVGSDTASLQLRHTLKNDNKCRKVGRPLVYLEDYRQEAVRNAEPQEHHCHLQPLDFKQELPSMQC